MKTFSRGAALALLLATTGFAVSASASSTASASSVTTNASEQKKKKKMNVQHLPLIPHHSDEARRRKLNSAGSSTIADRPSSDATSLRRRTEAVQMGALYQGYGTHYIDLWVGTPPQRQTLIVDTGSGVTAFPCSECDATTCGKGHHIDNFFVETDSSSYEKIACGECQRGHCTNSNNGSGDCKIGMSYQEGSSWSAFEAKDMVYIGGPHDHGLTVDNGGSSDLDPGHAFAFSFPMTFGCQTKLTGLFKTQLADGIMGMDDANTAFWAQMYKANIISDKQFSLCFTRQPLPDKKGTEAGAMTMGGYDVRLHSSPMVYSGRVGSSGGFYNVHVRKVYLRHGSGGEGAKSTDPNAQVVTLSVSEDQLNHGNVIVDSGTTDTYFTRRIATEFNTVYQQLSGRAYSHSGVSLTEDELKALPTILIQLAGDEAMNKGLFPTNAKDISGLAGDVDPDHPYDILLAIPPTHYMEYDDKAKKYVARFYADEGGGSVLGANAMMGHDVYFDLDDKRIGWAESDCDYHELVTNGGFVDSIGGSSATSVKPETPTTESKQTPNGSGHDGASPSDADTIHEAPSKMHPAIDACNDASCRGAVGAILIGFLVVGLAIGRGCRNNSSRNYRATEATGDFELSPPIKGSDGIYRDDPEMDDVDFSSVAAPKGTGYTDEVVASGLVA